MIAAEVMRKLTESADWPEISDETIFSCIMLNKAKGEIRIGHLSIRQFETLKLLGYSLSIETCNAGFEQWVIKW